MWVFAGGRIRSSAVGGTVSASSAGTGEANGGRATPPALSASDDVTALAALYQGDRGDAASSMNAVLALVGATIAYITATLAFSEDINQRLGRLSVFIPTLVWFIAAFHSLMVATSMLRGASLKALEAKLLRHTTFTPEQRDLIGMRSYERVMNIADPRAGILHRAANAISYAGIFLALIFYTTYFIIQTQESTAERLAAFAAYSILCSLVVASFIAGISIANQTDAALSIADTGSGPNPPGHISA